MCLVFVFFRVRDWSVNPAGSEVNEELQQKARPEGGRPGSVTGIAFQCRGHDPVFFDGYLE